MNTLPCSPHYPPGVSIRLVESTDIRCAQCGGWFEPDGEVEDDDVCERCKDRDYAWEREEE